MKITDQFADKDKQFKKQSFVDLLETILEKSRGKEEITFAQIFEALEGRGYAVVLILFSLPFCFPIQIPGFSTPFGLVLGFIGLRVAFGKKLWWPKWILKKTTSTSSIEKLILQSKKLFTYLQKMVHPRLYVLIENPLLHRIHGVTIFFLAVLLALPLPLPMSNMICAVPILCIGLGLLEDDGLFIIIGYIFATICFIAYAALFIFGTAQLMKLFQ